MLSRLKYLLSNIYKIHKIKKVFMFHFYYPYLAKYFSRKEIETENINGKYIIPRIYAHSRSARFFLCREVYESETINYIKKNFNYNGDIIHAGCYWGDHLPALSKIIGKNLYVHAFEPNDLSFKYAKKNIKLNNLFNVVIKNCALGEKKKSMLLKVLDEKGNILGGMTRIDESKNFEISEKKHKIEIETLDSLIPVNTAISIIFLDVESYEENVLQGAVNILKRYRPILILEHFDKKKFEKSIIKTLNYSFDTRCDNNYIYSSKIQ